jgi:hypothetical protein
MVMVGTIKMSNHGTILKKPARVAYPISKMLVSGKTNKRRPVSSKKMQRAI